MEKTLTKYFIKQVKEQKEIKEWEKNNLLTTTQFLKPYTIKHQTNQKLKSYGTPI
tara:strand:+ start:804 stop:968 length:165 start_codon:yes stop_codon:yes gene_type:complete